MSEALLTSYEEVPYESKPVYRTNPDGLATVAVVFGLRPPPVERCRVLELGGAAGGNLIPVALTHPEGRFLGIDLSPRQIADGQKVVDALGLKNVELRAMSILDIDEGFGQFDYITCHGVFSWVPPEVQDKILDVCKRNLAPDGIAYVSYNTYPGWHLRGMVRDMMRYHAAGRATPQERVRQARAMLDFLVQASAGSDTTYDCLLRDEAGLLAGGSDSYLFHEQLEEFNHPVYFHEFAERAAGHGLQFLAEAQFSLFDQNMPALVRDTVAEWSSGDLVRREQYLDFLRCRTFRRSLLCHAGAAVRRESDPAVVTRMHLSALAKPQSAKPDVTGSGTEAFHAPDGAHLTTNHPFVKAALVGLFELWPRAVSFDVLCQAVRERLGPAWAAAGSDKEVRQFLAGALLQCYLGNIIEMHLYPPQFTLFPGERPVASPLARLQADAGQERVTSLSHRIVELSLMDRLVLRHLDGRHDRAALLGVLAGLAKDGTLALSHEGKPLTDGQAREYLTAALDLSLRRLAAGALLLS
jgi:methyltransferase-like protein/cyclopropane fatty-acyl-phospholipid synthase-like methyltransferase